MSDVVTVRTRAELESALQTARDDRSTIALVATMGALHDGHLELLRDAADRADVLVASIFVNPTQFGPGEDLDRYPRSLENDLLLCARAGVDVVFTPDVATMYPEGLSGPRVGIDPGPTATILEGAARPTHFAGVLTVVAKLVALIGPDVAVFGEKDYQQLVLVRAMARALCLPTEIVGAPTVREPDGLAMSSRNRYLDAEQRTRASALSRALRAGATEAARGPEAVLDAAHAVIDGIAGVDIDYLTVTDPDLGPPHRGAGRLLVAATVGRTRLLDNVGVELGVGSDAVGEAS